MLTTSRPSHHISIFHVLESIQGSMTLEQSWHPYLSDKSSQVYRVLEQTVVAAVSYL